MDPFSESVFPLIKGVKDEVNELPTIPSFVKKHFTKDLDDWLDQNTNSNTPEADREMNLNQKLHDMNQKFFMYSGRALQKTKVIFGSLF